MEYRPHRYQQYAIDFIVRNPIAAILLDMGMGKTSLALMAINKLMYEEFEVGKVLIIAPLRVAKNTWPAEIEKWEPLKGLRYSVIVGTPTQRKKALMADADIYIVNRENLTWLAEDSGIPFDFDMVVIDELSSFKSWQAKRFKSLMKVRPLARRIVGLTGTPSSNGLMDLFAEFKVLDMGERLGRFIGQYRLNYFKPDRMNGPIVYSYKPLPGAEEKIYDRISDITISMKAADYLDMPELIVSEYPVYMSAKEREIYDAMKENLIVQELESEVTAANAASLSGKLSQMANGAVYSDDGAVIQIHDGSWRLWRTLLNPPAASRSWWPTGISMTTAGLRSGFPALGWNMKRWIPMPASKNGTPESCQSRWCIPPPPDTASTCRAVDAQWYGSGLPGRLNCTNR